MPGKEVCVFSGLSVSASVIGERGIYFTDQVIEVNIELYNTNDKVICGELIFFYGFGPTGNDKQTQQSVLFNIQPRQRHRETILSRLIGVQGNNIIGVYIPHIQVSNQNILVIPSIDMGYRTLYTFVSMEREFYSEVYARPVVAMEQTNRLQRIMLVLTIAVVICTVFGVVATFTQMANTKEIWVLLLPFR